MVFKVVSLVVVFWMEVKVVFRCLIFEVCSVLIFCVRILFLVMEILLSWVLNLLIFF